MNFYPNTPDPFVACGDSCPKNRSIGMNRLFHFDTKLSELSMTQFKLFGNPFGGIEVGYFLCAASLAKLPMIIRCTNPSFIAISIVNCAEHLFSKILEALFCADLSGANFDF